MSNHRSNFDPMVQWWVLRRWPLAFVSKPSNMRKFVIGPFVRRCCFLPIDRENARNALTTINAAANLIRAHVCSFAIYPEGTRSKSGELLPWHAGSLKIAQKANVPIVVGTVEGTERIARNVPGGARTCMCASARSSPPRRSRPPRPTRSRRTSAAKCAPHWENKKRRTEHSSAKCGRVFFHFIGRTMKEMHMNFLYILSLLIHFCQKP